jgi:hypothetical protein
VTTVVLRCTGKAVSVHDSAEDRNAEIVPNSSRTATNEVTNTAMAFFPSADVVR